MEEEYQADIPQTVDQYIIIKTIGSGAFATVYLAQHAVTQTMVALKCIAKKKLKNQAEFELLQREVNLMRSMDHPFIVSFYEVLDDKDNFYISMELIENENLLDYINNNQGLGEQQARRVFSQLVAVLEYLHVEKRVMHRDLKAENVLLDKNYNVRLVDFGLSKAFSKNDPFLQTTCGSPAYVAPEIIKEKPYTSAADIWSLGVLLYAMVAGHLPFNGDNISMMLQEILNSKPQIPKSLSPNLRELISRLLIKEPGARITLQQIIEHPWLTEFEDSRLLTEDFGLINSFKVVNPQELDAGVVSEMRILGYDTAGLLQELKTGQINKRTAAYKMLKKQRTMEELHSWQNTKATRTSQQAATKLPSLDGKNENKKVRYVPKRRKRTTVPVPVK